MEKEEFRTQKGYDIKNNKLLTLAMEDYLEMICRHSKESGYIRISHLATLLNVKTSSASKMVVNLNKIGYVEYEKYGIVKPTQKGWEMGDYLLYRHNLLNRFFCYINQSENELEQIEQIEHYINYNTIKNIEKLLLKLEKKETP